MFISFRTWSHARQSIYIDNVIIYSPKYSDNGKLMIITLFEVKINPVRLLKVQLTQEI